MNTETYTDWSGFENFFENVSKFFNSISSYINILIHYMGETFVYLRNVSSWFVQMRGAFVGFDMFGLFLTISFLFLCLKFVRAGK